MVQKQTIGVLGCGWLGFPLASYLVEKDFQVKGSKTATDYFPQLTQRGIKPFEINFNPSVNREKISNFLQVDILIIAIPPRIRTQGQDFHITQIQSLIAHLQQSTVKKIIYISSTSVYPNVEKEVFEEDVSSAETANNQTLWQVENLLLHIGIPLTVLRCGGLMGYDRIPVKYFEGKKGLTTGKIPVNFVHRDDVIEIIYTLLQQDIWGEVLNVVAPQHPIREKVYLKNATDLGFTPPEFLDVPPKNFKIINGDKLIRLLSYAYKYPDPLSFRYKKK